MRPQKIRLRASKLLIENACIAASNVRQKSRDDLRKNDSFARNVPSNLHSTNELIVTSSKSEFQWQRFVSHFLSLLLEGVLRIHHPGLCGGTEFKADWQLE